MGSAAPLALLPYQQRWCSDKADVKVIEKSRRIGISWCTAAFSVLEAAEPGGQDQWYIGYNQDMAQEFVRDATDWAEKFQLAASEVSERIYEDPKNDILMYEIRFSSGYRIKALSSRPTNIRGKQGRVIIDEAAFHDNLAGIIKAAVALLIWGGNVDIISTHDGVDSEFNKLVGDIRSGKLDYSLHRVTIQDALDDGLYKRICVVRGIEWSAEGEAEWLRKVVAQYGDDADEELKCIPKKSGGDYFKRDVIERAQSAPGPVLRLELDSKFFIKSPEQKTKEIDMWCRGELAPLIKRHITPHGSWWWYVGEDFGRVSDLTVIAPMALKTDMSRVVPFMIELRNVPFDQQREILFYLCDRIPTLMKVALDQTGNGQYMAEKAVERYGQHAEAVSISETFYREHMPVVRSHFDDNQLSIPKDLNVLSDLQAVQLINGIPKLPKHKTQSKGQAKRHGDAAIALLMAVFASRGKVSTGVARKRTRTNKTLTF
jgi:phage FluMu gp28-like protein